jgi:hypothetical protein
MLILSYIWIGREWFWHVEFPLKTSHTNANRPTLQFELKGQQNMTTFIIILGVIIFIVYLIGSSKTINIKNNTTSIKNTNKSSVSTTDLNREKIPTVAELVKEIETIEDFETFERKQEEVYKIFSEDYDNKYYERLYNRYEDAYSKISDKISNKAFFYQYTPYIDLDTTLKDLSMAFAHFTPDEYKLKKKGTSIDDWQEITGNELMNGGKVEDAIEKKPEYFQALIEFREVIESKLTLQEKHENIIEIAKNNASFKKEFFEGDESSLEKQCLIWLMGPFKIPLLDKLIGMGFDTPDKIKSISEEYLKTISGFGPSKIEQFNMTINKIKKL